MNINEICKDEDALRRYYSLSYEVCCIIDNILSRFEDYDIKSVDNLYSCIDDELIYYEDQWSILQEYSLPTECSWEEAFEQFFNDLLFIATFCFDMID